MKILLVDDHALFRAGLKMVLQAMDSVAEVVEIESGLAALAAVDDADVDLVLLDYQLEDVDGLEVLARFKRERPELPVIMLSAHEDAGLIQAALAAEASGFITKSSTSEVMTSAINLVMNGGVYIPPQLLAQVGAAGAIKPKAVGSGLAAASADAPYLTERQLEVMAQMAKGLSNKEIARELNMSPSTVKVHVAAILKEFDVKNRTQAVSFARDCGLIE